MPKITDNNRADLIQQIHDSPLRIVLIVAGGGNAVITDLLDVPGASRTVLEVTVPYAPAAMLDVLGAPLPAGAVSADTARALAEAAYDRAVHLREQESADESVYPVLGVACTAALATDRPKKGAHRAHVALAGPGGSSERRIDLVAGALSRQGEDRAVSDGILLDLLAVAGLDGSEYAED